MGVVYQNGRLTKVTATGTSPDYDTPAAPGADRWTGDVGVTVRERHVEQIAGSRIDQVDESHLVLPYDVGSLVVRGDTLEFVFEGATHQRTAGTIVRAQLTGRVRVDLENA